MLTINYKLHGAESSLRS